MAYATHQHAHRRTQFIGKAIAIAAAVSLVSGFGAAWAMAPLKASPGSQQSIAATPVRPAEPTP